MRRLTVRGLAAAAAMTVSGAAAAQTESTMTIYSQGHFKGGSISLTGPLMNIDPAFTAKSIQITGGGSWEVCNGRTYSGCRRLDGSVPAGVFSIRSARPIAPVLRYDPAAPAGSGGVANRSLRGVASEFFVAPTRGSQRVSVPGNKPEAMRQAATDFCLAAGWRSVAHVQMQDVGGTYYLVDLLCANDPN